MTPKRHTTEQLFWRCFLCCRAVPQNTLPMLCLRRERTEGGWRLLRITEPSSSLELLRILTNQSSLELLPLPQTDSHPCVPQKAISNAHPHLVPEHRLHGTKPLRNFRPTLGTFQNLCYFKATTEKYQRISFICYGPCISAFTLPRYSCTESWWASLWTLLPN